MIAGEIQGERTISGGWEIIGNYSKLFRALLENPVGNRKLWENYSELSHRGVFFATDEHKQSADRERERGGERPSVESF